MSKFGQTSPLMNHAPPAGAEFWNEIRTDLDFALIGAPKSGTTWVAEVIARHPGAFCPGELNFFAYRNGRSARDYDRYFSRAGTPAILGDHSNTFMLDDRLPRVFATRWRRARLILVCREPVSRARSHFLMDVAQGDVPADASLEDVLRTPRTFSYFDFGLYAKHLKRYFAEVERERILVCIFERLRANPRAEFARIFDHLGLEARSDLDTKQTFRNTWEQQVINRSLPIRTLRRIVADRIPASLRARLRPFYHQAVNVAARAVKPQRPVLSDDQEILQELAAAYRDPNAELEQLLGHDLSCW